MSGHDGGFGRGLSRYAPRSVRARVIMLCRTSGYGGSPLSLLGGVMGAGVLLGAMVLLLPFAMGHAITAGYWLVALAFVVVCPLLLLLLLDFRAEDRAKHVEEVLPDALQLIGANIRAGMTPFMALQAANRKEFGPLTEELDTAMRHGMGTLGFEKACMRICERIHSEALNRTMTLFTTALRSGGRLARMLEEMGRDLADRQALRRELVTGTKTYTAFIMFAVIIGAPLLLSISVAYLGMVSGMKATTGPTAGFGLDFLSGDIGVTQEFLLGISGIMLGGTALLASILLGAIQRGRPLSGLRMAPLMVGATLLAFYVLKGMMAGFVAGLV
ncbi:hypothetical protein AUJ68_06725 [Candidatus Woesearchaeota archaeon CG1_02_57_44]|nr:MAG: hypothetical protein AUJ68_06725 [Candidatus Woesearchaeota archaeon CG1_02_57_44]